jgi:hypothetical protein
MEQGKDNGEKNIGQTMRTNSKILNFFTIFQIYV